MHGEYKVPNGKLVVVDLRVEGDRLRNVELSGDFFIIPEDRLWRITAALEGAPARGGDEDLAERVRAAAGDAELVGITPEGVVSAVRRAVEDTAS